MHPDFAILGFAFALVANGIACRADARQIHRIELEFTGWDDVFPARGWLVLMAFAVFVFLVLELRCQWPFILTHLWPIKLTHPL
jgi:hypothetical protein